jgi:molybdopterin molybdotransferase
MRLLTVDEALARILDDVEPLAAELIPLASADGRTLAADLAATLTQPPFDASAMDGYAVRRCDVAELPTRLRMIGQSRAGERFLDHVGPRECVRIFTGAPVPAGADAIVIQENAEPEGASILIRDGTCDPARIRPRGGDFKEGDVLLRAGQPLNARAILLAAAMGHGAVTVRRKPLVAVLATGDELVAPGTRPGADQIVSSNPYGLAALVAAAGGEPRILGIASDTLESIEEKIAAGSGADVLVTTGGASVGDHDLVAEALKRRGMQLDFWKIAMRPGKPMLFGRLDRQRVLALPGNPVSALICGRVFLVPLIQALLGAAARAQTTIRAHLTSPLPENGPRRHYMRATLARDADGRATVTPMSSQDSSLMAPLAKSDVLIVREIAAPAIAQGSEIDVLMIDF